MDWLRVVLFKMLIESVLSNKKSSTFILEFLEGKVLMLNKLEYMLGMTKSADFGCTKFCTDLNAKQTFQ